MLTRSPVERHIRSDMDAVGANSLGALGIVLDEEGHLSLARDLAQPGVPGRIDRGPVAAEQDASHVSLVHGFRHRGLERGRRPRWKLEIEAARGHGCNHHRGSACVSARIEAALTASVSNHLSRGAVNVCRGHQAATNKTNGRSKRLLNIGIAFTTLSQSRSVEEARVATPLERSGNGTVRDPKSR